LRTDFRLARNPCREIRVFRILICAILATTAYADDAEQHVRKTVNASTATRLVLNAEYGSIHAHPATGNNVDVDVYFRGYPPSRAEFDRMLRDFSLDVDHNASELRITGKFKNGRKPYINDAGSFLSWLFGGSSVWLRNMEYEVNVPARLESSMNTSGGSISAEGLRNSINVRTSGGAIHVSAIQGNLDAWTSGGSIAIDQVSGFVNAHTSGGALQLHDLNAGVDASTSGGGVTAAFADQPSKDSRLSTSGGSINVRLGEKVHLNVDASTSGGSVSTDFAPRDEHHRSELRTELNGGGPLLRLHTSGGGISIRHAISSAELHGRSSVN
jgi:hypothetical protein